MEPVVLPPNQSERFYRGGARIAAFRGLPSPGDRYPEDWVGSTTALFGQEELGLSRFENGEALRDLVRADPQAWLGPEHARAFGAETGLLVKLLDAGQRLPVHAHPDRAFARRHLSCPYGKTEAWIVTGTEGGSGLVHLGFHSDVEPETLRRWVQDQDGDGMLAAMHAVPVEPGDAVLVPAGLPHAIGEGVLLVELQEPTDFSVLLEWEGFALDGPRDGHLGLGFDLALQCVDRRGWDVEELQALRRRDSGRAGVEQPLPREAEPYFRAERLRPAPELGLEPGFSVLVVLEGSGELAGQAGHVLSLQRGMTVLVPYAAGTLALRGPLHVLRCRPPATAPADGV